ncbi:hypothetical protein HCN44_000507 [Aphidius gifuensis]|uniref:Uncharacterized protein n=1 Tax=Aphidius gifuensis TaxID=684658 RepID=A0A834XQF2_APHGI|nr:uncharacterized protein LOC122854615 [Aphidius gifuensis]XP_044011374.1 uncharacterized protein LOC122854615 [Aphidius gifuensis]KAF7990702.1 hypothetical protein HCN44_000507 [Aphidius gifuensis]
MYETTVKKSDVESQHSMFHTFCDCHSDELSTLQERAETMYCCLIIIMGFIFFGALPLILKNDTNIKYDNIDTTIITTTTTTPPPLVKSSTSTFKRAKMPRVTLKLRENETIPKMYMEVGITSYKKGNITTSVLANDLSLEGLIFKTPEGTIIPWNEKWPFSKSSSSYGNFKTSYEMTEQLLAILVTLMAVMFLIVCVLILTETKMKKCKFNNIEEALIPERIVSYRRIIIINVNGVETELMD